MTSASSAAKRIDENYNIDNNDNNNERINREGLGGWLNPTRYGWERVSYWFQRLTGIFLLVYFIGHVYETSSLVNGPDAWAAMLEMTPNNRRSLILNSSNRCKHFSFSKWNTIDIY